MNKPLTLFAVVSIVFFSTILRAQDKPGGKVHGLVFGDYFYMIGADTTGKRGSGQFSSTEKDFQAFQLRRLYLYYDHHISEDFFAQFLIEGNEKIVEQGGRHGLFIKTAYLEWKNLLPMGTLAFGLVPTPTWGWGLSEKTWNYRSVEKTITDFRGLGIATDIGIAMRGKFNSNGTFNYVAMIGNGNAQKPEFDKYKKFYLSLNVKPAKELIIEGYADYECVRTKVDETTRIDTSIRTIYYSGDSVKVLRVKTIPTIDIRKQTRLTLKAFIAYQTEKFTVGAELLHRTDNPKKNELKKIENVTPFGISLFAWAPIPGRSDLNAFARFDFYNPDTKVSNAGYNENFITAGIDYMPIKSVHIIPNIWINKYSNKNSGNLKRDADIVGRITFFYVYK